MGRFTVILDACVLYPSRPRDTLLRLGQAGFFRPRWTTDIHAEWMGNLRRKRPDCDPGALERTRQLMDKAIDDCLVTGYSRLVASLTLPDPDDRHILAAAIAGGANAIVTFNLTDFPADVLAGFGLEAIHCDDFVSAQFDLNPGLFLACIREQRAALRRSPPDVATFVAGFEKAGMPRTALLLRDNVADLT